MKKINSHTLTVIAIGMLAALSIGITSSGSARGEQDQQNKSVKWEYCLIADVTIELNKAGVPAVGSATVCYFEPAGCRREIIQASGDYPEEARLSTLAKATAMLGQNGWQMVGEGSNRNVLYFGRPKK